MGSHFETDACASGIRNFWASCQILFFVLSKSGFVAGVLHEIVWEKMTMPTIWQRAFNDTNVPAFALRS